MIKPPKTKRQLRHFLGMVNYYRDMWRRRSHVLAPLTALVSDAEPWRWGPEQQTAFDDAKRIVSSEAMLAFPDFSLPFHVYTDASKHQLGAVLVQNDKPLAFYSRKFNAAQARYTTGEQELLSIVEALKEFRTLLLGNEIIVHTDHKNILYSNLANDRIARWRMLLEEYGAEFEHIKGKENIVADALSRMEREGPTSLTEAETPLICAHMLSHAKRDESLDIPGADDIDSMAEAFAVSATEPPKEKFPMAPRLIAHLQKKDKTIQKLLDNNDQHIDETALEGYTLLTYNEKIIVPAALQQQIVAWYHLYLRHPGQTRMEATLRQTFWWRNLRADVENHVRTCKKCQLNKKSRKKYGHLPVKDLENIVPWNRVNVDLIGPLTVKTPSGKTHELLAFTMIDPATGWFEVVDVPDKEPDTIAAAFDDTWLCRYPRPQYIGYDNGSELKRNFRELLENYGLKGKPTTTRDQSAEFVNLNFP